MPFIRHRCVYEANAVKYSTFSVHVNIFFRFHLKVSRWTGLWQWSHAHNNTSNDNNNNSDTLPWQPSAAETSRCLADQNSFLHLVRSTFAETLVWDQFWSKNKVNAEDSNPGALFQTRVSGLGDVKPGCRGQTTFFCRPSQKASVLHLTVSHQRYHAFPQ